MLFGDKKLYNQTCALKRGEQKLPPLLENLRSRIAGRLNIRVLNIVYDRIDLGPAKGMPRLNIIVDAQSDLCRIKENLFNFKPDAHAVILEEFSTTAKQADWDCQKVHLISDDFSDEAMNQAVFQFFGKIGNDWLSSFQHSHLAKAEFPHMKRRTEKLNRDSGRHWLMMLALGFALIAVYISGAVASRVPYQRGVLRDGSATLNFLETVFTPVHSLYSHSPTFKSGFDWCAGIFLPKQKEATK